MIYILCEEEVIMLNLTLTTLALNEAHAKMARYQQDAAVYCALPRRSLRSRAAEVLRRLADRLEPHLAPQLQPINAEP
jgi:hypothetical protein